MFIIKKIDWFFESGYSGDITLVDNYGHEIVCFTYGYPTTKYPKILFAEVSNIFRSYNKSYSLRRIDNYEYEITGQILSGNCKKTVVECYGYIMEFRGALPHDIMIGEWVELDVDKFFI